MAPNIVPAFVKRQAGNVANYIRARAQHEYNEMALKVETGIWQSKDHIKASTPVRMYTGVGNWFNGYKKTRAREATADALSKIRVRSGRIDKDKRLRFNRKIHIIPSTEVKCKAQLELTKEKHKDWVHTASGRPLGRVQGGVTKERSNTYHGGMPKIHYTLAEAQPKSSYMESVRTLHPTSDDYEERRKRTAATLNSILGPERANVGVGLPSGHSGNTEDPILSNYHYEKNFNDILDLHQEYQLQQRRQWEERQRRAEEKEIIRTKKLALLEAACTLYDTRVAKLAEYGPKLDTEITKLLTAFDGGDTVTFPQAATALINEVLEPAAAIFEEMKNEILLESTGAEILKNAWPLPSISKVLETFNAPVLSRFTDTYMYAVSHMLQGFLAITQPIHSAVPLTNPLGDEEALPFVAAPIPVNFQTYAASVQRKQADVAAPVAVLTPEGPNTGKNFTSFAALVASNRAHPPVPAITITPPSKISDELVVFQDNLRNLVPSGTISVSRRKEMEPVLTAIKQAARGTTGFLPSDGDCGVMKTQVEQLVFLLSNLRNRTEKNRASTKLLVELAKKVEKLWA
ncbi:hypothetical protein CC86DRAFT_407464 [Ophiobolus disseminans]|uniref:SEA domain-containing protein n=1 Tax=Ophiobolus disseminans TaxID=1469910 RepID=A0A6A6ZW44_9PLEO|nr:hypothetical protein CC86DRAFT_407464 [Ophiobolus disseminans]